MKNFFRVMAALTGLIFAACSVTSGSKGGESGSITSLEITASSDSMTATGSVSLTAKPAPSDVSATYTWEITAGSEFAELSATSGKTVTLTGKNAGAGGVTVSLTAYDGKSTKTTTKAISITAGSAVTAALNGVSIGGTTEIEAAATATLTATPSYTGDIAGEISYTWEITSDSTYATISSSGASATITGTNSTDSSQSVTVKVTATYGTTSKTATQTVTVAAQGVDILDAITGLELIASSSTAAPDGTVTLTPKVTYTGSVSESQLSVSGWAITSGNSYASLKVPSTGASRSVMNLIGDNTSILQAANTDTSAHTVTASVTVSFGGVTETATCDVTVQAASVDSVSISGTTTLAVYNGSTTLTANVSKTGNPASVTYNWEITDGSEYAEITVGASTASAVITGTNDTASAHTVTVKVTVSDGKNSKTATQTVSVPKNTTLVSPYFPENGAADAYADTYLEIEFDSAPVINRASSGTVRIYTSGGTLVDTIKPAAETMYGYGYGGNSGLGSINVQYQLIQVVDTNKVRIIPHHNTSTGMTLLSNNTSYYVLIDSGIISGTIGGSSFAGITDSSVWAFTTGSAPSPSGSTLTVGEGKQFITVQGAMSYLMKNSKTGTWTIKIEPGTYYERVFYHGSANLILSGQGSATYGTDVEIQWCNQDGDSGTTLWNTGSRGRNVFYYAGKDLTLENISFINTATRYTNSYGEYDSSASDTANGKNQAEALMFDSTGNCAAYNCNFKSKQDTIYLSPSGGKAWFYGCKISGDIDFIWGLSDVALIERCNIISTYDARATNTYVLAPHLSNSSAPYGKGFVLYNSTVTTESGQTTYLARSPWGSEGNISQVAVIDTAVTGGLASNPWYGSHVGGADETVLGWKWYGVTSDGSSISAANKLSQAQYEAEFAGRNNIINRTYDGSAFSKAASTWDVNTLASDMSWTVVADSSKATLDGESEITTVTFDFTAQTSYSAWDSITSISAEGDSTNTAEVSGLKWHSTNYGANVSVANSTVSFAVTGACTVTVYNSYTVATDVSLAVGGTTVDTGSSSGSDSCTLSYTGTASGTAVVTIASSGAYISKIVVTYTSSGSSGEEKEVTVTYFPSSASSFSAAGTSSDTGIVTAASASASTGTTGSLSTAFGAVNSVSSHYYSTGSVSGAADDTILTLTLSLTAVEDFTIKSVTGALNESATGNISRTLKVGSNTAVSLGSGKELSVDQTGINYAVTAGNTVSIVFTTTATESYSGKTFKQLFKDIVITVSTTASGSGNSGSGTSSEGETASLSDVIIDNGSAISDGDTSSRSSSLAISATDTPTGYAGVSSPFGSMSWTTYTVSTRSDLVSKAKHSSGNYFIIVDGMIDMTDGMLPSVGGGTTDELDAFVNTKTSGAYTTYAAWVEAYAEACSLTSDDETSGSGNTTLYSTLWTLSDAYKSQIQLVVKSNTIIVGKDASSGIKGASISMNGVSNVELRNLIIQDAYDPFPHHEVKDDGVTSDGYNAQWDCITIQGDCSYIWIDHCTIQDTMTLGHVYTGGTGGTSEKWQTYDGLLDIKGTGANITVSYCKFKNHDKTSLIGSSDSEGSSSTRLITYHHNYFYNCGQRLPMVRNTTMHLYNNYYAYSSGDYSQQYAVGVRKGSVIYAENNFFDSGIKYAFSDSGSSSSSGTLYSSGNTNNASSGQSLSNSVGSTLFSAGPAAYTYTAETASTVKINLPSEAGTGAVTIN